MTPQQLIDNCRLAVGTAFQHQGRLVGPQGGIDCVGLVNYGLGLGGLELELPASYYPVPNESELRAGLERYADEIDEQEPGCLLRLVPPRMTVAVHLAVVTEALGIIHAVRRRGVIELSSCPSKWHVADIWRVRGVE